MRKWFYKPQLNRFDLDEHFVPILMGVDMSIYFKNYWMQLLNLNF